MFDECGELCLETSFILKFCVTLLSKINGVEIDAFLVDDITPSLEQTWK